MSRLALLGLVLMHVGAFATVFKAIDAPPPTVVRGQADSADRAVTHVFFSEAIEGLDDERVSTGVDLIALEVERVRQFIAAPGPIADKRITYVRYTSGDLRLAQALIDAKSVGIAVDILVDLNPVLTLETNDLEEMTNDFDRAFPKYEDSPGYRSYEAFLKGGFKLGRDLFSQPIYRPSATERTPIFHEKSVVFENGRDRSLLISSANAAPNPRVNRTLELREDALTDYYLDHVRDLKVLFSGTEARPIRDLPARAPLVITFDDGSSIRMSFTDGKYNPNDNIVNVLRNKHLKSATLSHFAFTYSRMLDALVENLAIISPQARATLLLDDKFTDLYSWGVGLQAKGSMVVSPPFSNGNTRVLYSKPREVADRIDLFVYQRPALDERTGFPKIETDEDGPPLARHVNHEKTTVLVDTADRAYISFGSFNASGNFHNADVQLDIETGAAGWLHQAFDRTIHGLIAKERGIYAIPALPATVRNALGRMTGLTDLQVPLPVAERFIERAFWKNPKYVRAILEDLLAQETTLTNIAPLDQRRKTVAKFVDWLARYNQIIRPKHRNDHQLLKVLSMMTAVSTAPMSPTARKALVETPFFGIVPDVERQALVRDTMKDFGLEMPPPGEARAKKPAVASAFDFDNTFVVMPTKIRLFDVTSRKTRDVSTAEFAEMRMQLGQPGEWANWEFRIPDSIVEFTATENWRDGHFVNQLDQALGDPQGRAEAFEAWIEAMTTEALARMLYVVTARSNSRQEFVMGMVNMRARVEQELFELFGKKVTLRLPPLKNLYMLGGSGRHISQAKAEALHEIIAAEFKWDQTKTFRFYEDDVETRRVVTEFLTKRLEEGQMKRVFILDPSEAPQKWGGRARRAVTGDCDKILSPQRAG